MLYGLEHKMFESLQALVDDYELEGLKCEFEAEGSTFNDVVRLREVCSKLDIELHLKIGGGEAKRDVMDAIVLGVDGIIAPMIESPFAAHKFRKLMECMYPDKSRRPETAINIETRTAIQNIDGIISELSDGFLHHITFGRTDLSASYFDKNVLPDGGFINDIVKQKATEAREYGVPSTVGGSISVRTIALLRKDDWFQDVVSRIETRKCILPTRTMLEDGALEACLEFERNYLLALKERNDVCNKGNLDRLVKLEQRVV